MLNTGSKLLISGALAILLSAGAPLVQAQTTWQWPISNPSVIHGFAPPAKPWLPGHRGVDLQAYDSETVTSAGDGLVIFAGELAGRGVVSIVHGHLRTTYEPVAPVVHIGEVVSSGQIIGHIAHGMSHCSTLNHVICLHWGLRQGTTYLNPLILLKGNLRLFPI